MTAETEVAIIGAGPAGCVAARLLASWGHDVVVLSRHPDTERALGESLPPSCVSLLERVGISSLDAAGFLRATGNTVQWGGGDLRVEPFAAGTHGFQVDRAEFDAFMVREANGAGADVRLGANVVKVEQGDLTSLEFERDGRVEGLRARWVLDCSGRAGVGTRQLQIPRGSAPREDIGGRTMALVGVWDSDDPWPTPELSHTIVESSADGWAWSVPVSKRRRYITLMVDPAVTPLANREGLERAYLDQLARTRTLSRLSRGARRSGAVFARDASPYHAASYARAGLLLVGDAGSFVDPLSSFGIKKAVASAWLAAVVAHSCLEDPAIRGPALELFDAREKAMHDALQRSAAAQAREAAAAHPSAFWESRASVESTDLSFEPDVAALRLDPDVTGALQELRQRDAIRLRRGSLVTRKGRPTVRGNRVVVEDHLVVPAFPDGVRYIRNIDLLTLSDIAVSQGEVPDVFDAYNRKGPPAALPDFLGALAVLVGKGFLEWKE